VRGTGRGRRQPQEIPDEAYEYVLRRVCAIDVGKESAAVCTRLPGETDTSPRVSRVWEVTATVRAVLDLADHLVAERVEKVTIESTSDYWRIWYYVLEARGLDVQLVNARDVRNVPGRPKTDKLDAVWLAKLTERGLLRPSLVHPPEFRVLRDYTRMRVDLTRERTRHWQRLEKLLEDALIKLSAVASTLDLVSVRDMLEALIAGERNPTALARLARGRLRVKHHELVAALDGRFDDHHGELARMLLDQIDSLTAQIDALTARIDQLITTIPAARAPDPPAGQPPAVPPDGDATAPAPDMAWAPLDAVARLSEIPGISTEAAQAVIAEIGLDMSRFPTAAHLVSWTRLCPRTIQSGAKHTTGRASKGNPYLKGALGLAAASAGRTNTFLGDRYRRIARRRGKLKALVAVARSILVIIWHLLADPTTRFHDLGPDFHTNLTAKQRKARNHIRQLEALGYAVAITPLDIATAA